MFRDVLGRESVAPPWHDLARTFRRLEHRGDIRGGRFISGVAGEQFGTEEAVQQLRHVRELKTSDPWIVISAADPLNLVGAITHSPRVPATHKNAVIIDNGRYVASKEASQIVFFEAVSRSTAAAMTRDLRHGRTAAVEGDKIETLTSPF